MKLAKIRFADGTVRPAVVNTGANEARVLDLTQVENCHSLADVLHSPDPAGLANFLIDPNVAPLDLSAVTFAAPINR